MEGGKEVRKEAKGIFFSLIQVICYYSQLRHLDHEDKTEHRNITCGDVFVTEQAE